MAIDKIRKYVIPNIPYLFIFWAFLKLGTAYRMAAGTNFPLKLVGMMKTIAPVFETIAPGLNASDWLIGVIGSVVIRIIIFEKSKKANDLERMWSTAAQDGVHNINCNQIFYGRRNNP